MGYNALCMAVAEPLVEIPTVTIDPPRGAIGFDLGPLWEYRQLLFFFTWRDLKVRYKQTVLGASWALLQPLLATIVFTIFFGRVAHLPSDGVPYLIFSFAGTLPWTYFSNAMTAGSNSLVSAASMIAKVYFPRIALPISAVLGSAFDFLCAAVLIVPMMAWYGIGPSWRLLTLPLFFLLASTAALGMSFLLSALNVRYRDVRYVLPFLTQLWMFATPVVYSSASLHQPWRHPLRPQPDGRSRRRLPLGDHRRRRRSGPDDGRVGGDGARDAGRRGRLLPEGRPVDGGRDLMASASTVAIRTDRLSKRYTLGGSATFGYATLGESVANSRARARGARRPRRRSSGRSATSRSRSSRARRSAFIGRNGAGKTTLLKILSRITRPTEGRAMLQGRVGSLLEVGTGFHRELTGRENVYMNGALLGMTRREIRRRFDEIVAFAEVEDFLDTPVKRYSSGMTVRLAFSVAAHLEPEILLVDEVLAVGDAGVPAEVPRQDERGRRAPDGRSSSSATTWRSIQSLCRRGIYLEHGSVQTDAPIATAVADYLRALEDKAEALDISERVDRRGAQGVRVQTIDIRNRDASQSIASGAPIEITLGLSGTARGVSCVICIYDQLGHPVTELSSLRAGPDDVFEHQDEPRFQCHIDELLLVPGRYRIDLELYGGGLQDLVEGAAYFDVVDGVVRGRPISFAESAGHLIQPARWTGPDAG